MTEDSRCVSEIVFSSIGLRDIRLVLLHLDISIRRFTSPKAPLPITFKKSKSSLCNLRSFILFVNGFASRKRYKALV